MASVESDEDYDDRTNNNYEDAGNDYCRSYDTICEEGHNGHEYDNVCDAEDGRNNVDNDNACVSDSEDHENQNCDMSNDNREELNTSENSYNVVNDEESTLQAFECDGDLVRMANDCESFSEDEGPDVQDSTLGLSEKVAAIGVVPEFQTNFKTDDDMRNSFGKFNKNLRGNVRGRGRGNFRNKNKRQKNNYKGNVAENTCIKNKKENNCEFDGRKNSEKEGPWNNMHSNHNMTIANEPGEIAKNCKLDDNKSSTPKRDLSHSKPVWGNGTAYLFSNQSSQKIGCGSKNQNNTPYKNNSGNKTNNSTNSSSNGSKHNNSNNSNNNSGGGGGGGGIQWDLFSRSAKQLTYSLGVLRRPRDGPGYTLESLCLHWHHRGLCSFFLLCYLFVTQKMFSTDAIRCNEFSRGNNKLDIEPHFKDVCFSYPYTERVLGERRYLLFYRYMPTALLLASAFVYFLRVGYVKKWEDHRLNKLWHDVWRNRDKYVEDEWSTVSKSVVKYIQSGQPSVFHYFKWIGCHLLTALMDFLLFVYFDFVLQGNFWDLVPSSLHSLQRDPKNFTDRLSTVFPPFVLCEVTPAHHIISTNLRTFGCHLTFMEIYEKCFLMIWMILVVLCIWSLLMSAYLSFGLIPYIGKYFVAVAGGILSHSRSSVVFEAIRLCSLSELHVLYLMKQWMSNVQFSNVLRELVDLKAASLAEDKKGKLTGYKAHTVIDIDSKSAESDNVIIRYGGHKFIKTNKVHFQSITKDPDYYEASAPLELSDSNYVRNRAKTLMLV